jgi:hypothetical protein
MAINCYCELVFGRIRELSFIPEAPQDGAVFAHDMPNYTIRLLLFCPVNIDNLSICEDSFDIPLSFISCMEPCMTKY